MLPTTINPNINIAFAFADSCNKILWCSHWQSSHHTFEENVPNRSFNCSLLSSCNPQHLGNTTYPIVTNSGSRICLPDPFKRRPCRPGCPAARRFCHGRCVAGGRGCFFAPCSRSPYREEAGSTCSQLAMEAEEEECQAECVDINTSKIISVTVFSARNVEVLHVTLPTD